jgi:hypothetical protein
MLTVPKSCRSATGACDKDPVHTIPAEFENGTKFLRLGVAFTRDAGMKKCETVTQTVSV